MSQISPRAIIGPSSGRMLLFAFALMLLGSVAIPRTLCIGSDGHVALETTVAGRCAQAIAAGNGAAAASLDLPRAGGCCGPCTDVATALSFRASDPSKTSPPALPIWAPLRSERSECVAVHACTSGTVARTSPSAPTSILRQISVLRC